MAAWTARGETHDRLLVTQSIHEWHKAFERIAARNHKLAILDQAMAATLSCFAEANAEMLMTGSFGAWKHEVFDRKKLLNVRAQRFARC